MVDLLPGLDKTVQCGERLFRVLDGKRNLLDDARFERGPVASEAGPRPRTVSELVEDQARPDRQLSCLVGLDGLSLESGEHSRLHQRVEPHGIECRQVACQPAHARRAAAYVSRRTQLLSKKDLLELF